MISVSDEDLKEAEARLAGEKGQRIVSQAMRLPSYLSLLLERQIHHPSPIADDKPPPAPRAKAARRRAK